MHACIYALGVHSIIAGYVPRMTINGSKFFSFATPFHPTLQMLCHDIDLSHLRDGYRYSTSWIVIKIATAMSIVFHQPDKVFVNI